MTHQSIAAALRELRELIYISITLTALVLALLVLIYGFLWWASNPKQTPVPSERGPLPPHLNIGDSDPPDDPALN